MQNEILENNNKHCVPPEKLHDFAMLINALVSQKFFGPLSIDISYLEIKELINHCVGRKKMSWTDEDFHKFLDKVCSDILHTGILPISDEDAFGYICLYTEACINEDEETVTLEINENCAPLFTAYKDMCDNVFEKLGEI